MEYLKVYAGNYLKLLFWLLCLFHYSAEEGVDSWGIIELQGDLESREGGSVKSQFVGDLHYTVQVSRE